MIRKKSVIFSVVYETRILKFKKMGEKSGWTYIEIPNDVAGELLPGNKKSFRVRGFLDQTPIANVSLLPMGKGNFIMPLNADLRKKIGKRDGAMLKVSLSFDPNVPQLNKDFLNCLEDEPEALKFFQQLPRSHQLYFSRWIESAKTIDTKAKRIARSIKALSKNLGYGEMLRSEK